MEALLQFMVERGISQTIVERFSIENIDPSSILVMSDEQFENFLPQMGDRIAVLNFCRRQILPKKNSLIERLKRKMDEKNNKRNPSITTSKKIIKKQTRMIEIGWVFSHDGKTYKHVRKFYGGGTRQIQIDRSSKVNQIKQIAVELFFPNGISSKGSVSDFSMRLVDFQLNDLDENLTVDEYYSLTALTKLRVYLATKPNDISKLGQQESVSKRLRSTVVPEVHPTVPEVDNYYCISSDDDAKDEKQKYSVDESREYLFSLISREDESFEARQNTKPELPSDVGTSVSTTSSGYNDEFTVLVNSILDGYDNGDGATTCATVVTKENSKFESISEILEELRKKINYEKVSHFNVYREDIFGCCVKAMRRKTFSPFNKISVKFSDTEGVSEGAVDSGGPSREMFTLALRFIVESRMFCGSKKKHLSLCGKSLEENLYFEAGRLIALSLIHGGPAPHFFSETLFACVVLDSSHQPSINDTSPDIKIQLDRLNDAKDRDEMQDVILSSDIFTIAGFSYITNENEKEKILESTLKFYALNRIQEPLTQFVEGLKTCGVYQQIQSYPEIFKPLLCSDKIHFSCENFENIFKIIYSEIGSNLRKTENRIITYFRDYVLDCEERITESCTLEDILMFATGVDCIPPLGFPEQPQITFLHEESIRYPMANTCALHLKLPTIHKNYTDFKSDMDFGIGNAKSFGFA